MVIIIRMMSEVSKLASTTELEPYSGDLHQKDSVSEKTDLLLKNNCGLELEVMSQKQSIMADKSLIYNSLPSPISPARYNFGAHDQGPYLSPLYQPGNYGPFVPFAPFGNIGHFQAQEIQGPNAFYQDHGAAHEHQGFYGHMDQYENKRTRSPNKKRRSLEQTESSKPAEKTKVSRKKTIINPCECSGTCGRKIAMIYLRGPVDELEKTYLIDVLCTTCSGGYIPPVKFVTHQYVPTTRKKSINELKLVECEVCRRTIGNGGIRLADSDDAFPEELSVEFVCTYCTLKFQFCSECGGGGKTRTGKWRPMELFETGRRTCALPHMRVGDTTFKSQFYTQSQLTSTIVSQIQDVFFDSYISFYAIPFSLELQGQSFSDLINENIMTLWKDGVLNYLSNPESQNISRYVVLEWMDKQHRNKARAKVQKQDGSNSWLKIIGQEDNFNSLNLAMNRGSTDYDLSCISFGVAEWDQRKGVIFFPQIIPRSFFLKSFETYHHIIKTVIGLVQRDCSEKNIPLPTYIMLFGKNDITRTKGIPERLGFVEKDIFVIDNPSSKPFMDDLDYPVLKIKNSVIHVTTMDQFLLVNYY